MATETYVLKCIDCSFETRVEGSPTAAIAVADEHREAHEQAREEHFVDFEIDGTG